MYLFSNFTLEYTIAILFLLLLQDTEDLTLGNTGITPITSKCSTKNPLRFTKLTYKYDTTYHACRHLFSDCIPYIKTTSLLLSHCGIPEIKSAFNYKQSGNQSSPRLLLNCHST